MRPGRGAAHWGRVLENGLREACARHADGAISPDVTIQTCRDADRLDLGRVGIRPRAPYPGTEAARDPELLAWSRRRSVLGRVPECAAEWIRLAAPGR